MGRKRKIDDRASTCVVPGTSQQQKMCGHSIVDKPGTSKVTLRKTIPNTKGKPQPKKSIGNTRQKAKVGTSLVKVKRSRSQKSGIHTKFVKDRINKKNEDKRNLGEKNKPGKKSVTTTRPKNAAKPKGTWKKVQGRALKQGTRSKDKKLEGVVNETRKGESKVNTDRKRKRARSTSCLGESSDNNKPCKRSRTQSPVSMTTRSMRAKKVGVTRFIFDKVCNCPEHSCFNTYTFSGTVKCCPCGKRFEQFMKLTGGFDIENKNSSNINKTSLPAVDYFNILSVEVICYIFQYLSLKQVLQFESLSRKLQKAVHASLLIREEIDFNEEICDKKLFEENLSNMTDRMFTSLLRKIPRLRFIYNFHPANISVLQKANGKELTVPAVCEALAACQSLEGIEISNMALLENIIALSPHPKIIGKFQNRNQQFPFISSGSLLLRDDSKITNLHLVGCSVVSMPQMDGHLEHLYLRMVKFTNHHPFKDFSACKLKSFVMSHCIGPNSALKYIPLLTALADARGLKRLELQRVPFLGGVIQHICEDSWQEGGFRRLSSITMGDCKNSLDADLGFLIIAAAAYIETLRIQPTLTKDAVFSALAISDVTINPGFEELCLGWKESIPLNETWTNAEQVEAGLADLPESQARISDLGMKLVGQCFPPLKKLNVHNCHNLINPLIWFTPGQHYLRNIRELTLDNCHSLRVEKFCAFLTFLPELRYLTLQEIFKEPPLGCSRVGLSAGTGLGISAAFINPQPLANNPGGLNNNDNDDDANDAAENDADDNNPAAEQGQGDNREEDAGIENEVANQNEDVRNLANEIEAAEFENQNGGYNLRHSSRNTPSRSNAGQGSSRRSHSKESASRKSPRLSDKSHNSKHTRNDNNQEVCDKNNSLRPESSAGSGRDAKTGSDDGMVSKRGKALVTKKGLVNKVKSSKGKKKDDETMETVTEEETASIKKGCTCVKETRDSGCQATNDDIRKSCSHKSTRKKRAARKSHDKEKIITAGKYKPSSVYETPQPSQSCQKHRKRRKPATEDKCDSTNDPVWEEDHSKVLTILHRRLEYLKIDAVGITELSVVCYNLHTLSISRCRVLQEIKLKEAPFLENVHVSQCRKVNEAYLLDEIYRLPPNRSKFVSLRPLHTVNDNLYHDLMFFGEFQQYNFGTVMTFDYSDEPSKTNYNKLRMKSWINMLERMTMMTMEDDGWQRFHDMKRPNKERMVAVGESIDGSLWRMFSDIPWIGVLNRCPDMEEQNIKNPEWAKPGVYSMEAKGHFSFWDAYADVQDYIAQTGPNRAGLYEYNVLTYINMCDIFDVATQDALKVV